MTSWVIAGGGTGGHVTLALALGEEIARRGEPVLFIGTASRQNGSPRRASSSSPSPRGR